MSELQRRNVFRVGIAYAIVGWLLLQVADVLFPALTLPDWTNRLLAALLLLGFPVALLFAWAYELTPQGLRREHQVERSESIAAQTGRKLDFVIIAVLAVAVAWLLWDKIADRDARQPTAATATASDPAPTAGVPPAIAAEKSIAVLPFADMSPEQDQAYFSDGIAEELLNLLVRVDGLKVASRTSSFAFKGANASIPEIASKLRVDHVLEGSVRKAGDQLRITAQLIDVQSDRHLWSNTFDRTLADIFAIQEEISREIVSALKVALGADEARRIHDDATPTSNVEAYQLYLRGRAFWQRRGKENIRSAIELFEQTTALDPEFARAWAALAAAHLTLPVYAADEDFAVHWPLAERFADKALSMDPEIAECYSVKGDILRSRARWIEADNNYKKALELEPGNATAHLWYAEHLLDVGKIEEALSHLEVTIAVDPLSAGANAGIAQANFLLGNLDKAEEYARVARQLGSPGGNFWLAQVALERGDIAAARGHFADFQQRLAQPEHERFAEQFITALTDETAIPAFHARMESVTRVPPEAMIRPWVAHGRVDEALDYLHDTHLGRTRGWNGEVWYWWRADLAPLRRAPGFKKLVELAGLDDYWRANGWPRYCRPQGQDFACH